MNFQLSDVMFWIAICLNQIKQNLNLNIFNESS